MRYSPYIDLAQFWSLAVEEQFYLAWPLFVFFLKDLKKLIPTTCILLVCSVILRACLVYRHVNPWVIYMSVETRGDSLMMGALLALLLRSSDRVRQATFRAARYIAPAALLIILAMSWHSYTFLWVGPNLERVRVVGFSLSAIFFACLIAMTLDIPRIGNAFSFKPLRWFGRYSYGIYVFHPMLLAAAKTILPKRLFPGHGNEPLPQFVAALIGATLSLLLAYASFHLYEKRFLALKDRMRYRFLPREETQAANSVMTSNMSV